MRLVTYTFRGTTRLGALVGDAEVVDLNRACALHRAERGERRARALADFLVPPDMPAFLQAGDPAMDAARAALAHVREHLGTQLDFEGELCVVIGKHARHVAAADADTCVAGYMVGNDVSVRDWQFHSPTWVMGKSFDTHGPTGPWLVTRDEVPDPASLRLQTWVNGVLKQDASTGAMIFGVGPLVEYVSQAFTLEPGDVIFTGTPAGVGSTRSPREWLKAGDVVRVEITGLGVLENRVVDEP